MLADQANKLLTGVAATFGFFVGFAISVSWGSVNAGQVAVEQQAIAVRQMAWQLNNMADRAESAALMDKLRTYATTVAEQDDTCWSWARPPICPRLFRWMISRVRCTPTSTAHE